jgi:hypothetical protein
MANSTWFMATNSTLTLAALPTIASTTLFDSGPLSKYQNLFKFQIDFAHRYLSNRMATRFTNRKFQLPIVEGTTTYVLDTGISGESLKYHSWVNNTPGNAYARVLKYMRYEDFEAAWPDPTIIQSGPPEYIVQLPLDRTLDVDNPQARVMVFPVPDNSYNLQYEARLNCYPLTSSASIIMWPPEYEHALWAWAKAYSEIDLAEGREQALLPLAEAVLNNVRIMSMEAEEVRKGVRLMTTWGGRRRWRRSSGYFG